MSWHYWASLATWMGAWLVVFVDTDPYSRLAFGMLLTLVSLRLGEGAHARRRS